MFLFVSEPKISKTGKIEWQPLGLEACKENLVFVSNNERDRCMQGGTDVLLSVLCMSAQF